MILLFISYLLHKLKFTPFSFLSEYSPVIRPSDDVDCGTSGLGSSWHSEEGVAATKTEQPTEEPHTTSAPTVTESVASTPSENRLELQRKSGTVSQEPEVKGSAPPKKSTPMSMMSELIRFASKK